MQEEILTHMKIFHPYTIDRIDQIKNKNICFVHYTTADAAVSIIKNREVWMRNSTCMNDFKEVEHGASCLRAVYASDDVGAAFKETLEGIYEDLSREIEELFNGWWPHYQIGTYLVSFSEHDDEEDYMGRLSMWRAYGSQCGVALVMNSDVFFNESNALKAYTSPVAYFDQDSFKKQFERLIRSMNDNRALIGSYTRDQMKTSIFNIFKFAVLCTKHPGFREEREWRVVYTPQEELSPHILPAHVTIDGVPQIIQKIPLKNIPEEGLVGIEVPELVNRVIIGPTQYPIVICDAIKQALSDANVPDAGTKVWPSDIPIRR